MTRGEHLEWGDGRPPSLGSAKGIGRGDSTPRARLFATFSLLRHEICVGSARSALVGCSDSFKHWHALVGSRFVSHDPDSLSESFSLTRDSSDHKFPDGRGATGATPQSSSTRGRGAAFPAPLRADFVLAACRCYTTTTCRELYFFLFFYAERPRVGGSFPVGLDGKG